MVMEIIPCFDKAEMFVLNHMEWKACKYSRNYKSEPTSFSKVIRLQMMCLMSQHKELILSLTLAFTRYNLIIAQQLKLKDYKTFLLY